MKNFIIILIAVLLVPLSSWAATSIPFTISTSETVNVTGTPRIAVDVGGVTRYATYTSGTGTSSLTFTYTMVAGDVDLDGVTLTSPMQLNGGTIKDLNGNDATLTFTVPNTSNVKVNYPSLGMDFVADADGRYTLNGTVYNDLTSFLSAAGGTFTRASIGTYYDASGTLQTAASGTPRFDYDPVTHVAKGILIEESRTNLLIRSSEFDNATWVKSAIGTGSVPIVTPNFGLAPDGTMSADRVQLALNGGTTTADQSYMGCSPTWVAGNSYYLSIWMKTNDGSTKIIRMDANGMPGGNVTVTGDWQRFTLSLGVLDTPARPITMPRLRGAQGTSDSADLLIWGAQLERGALATSYIPTTAATATRQADDLIIPYGGWFVQASGTWNAEAYSSLNPNNGRIVGVSANSTNYLGYSGVSGATLETWDGSLNRTTAISPVASSSVYGKYAMNWSNGSMLRSIVSNNGAVSSGAIGLAYAGTAFAVGSNGISGNWIDSSIRKIKYYPARVTDAQLQLLTQ